MAERLRATTYANRYKVLRRIGEGSFGKVYLCQDLENEQTRRVLKKIRIKSDNSLENATREARIICVLEHPGVLNYFDHLQDKRWFIVVTEYCEGGDLKAEINSKKLCNGSFKNNEVQHMTVQLAMALEYIHSHGILHRDIKPENIYRCKDVLKIGDFGVSRVLQKSVVTQTFAGTKNYMAPEMISGQGYNSKADVWSLGCIVYEVCTLDLAFASEKGLFARIIAGPLPFLPSSTDSSTLSYIVEWTLERDVHTRMSASEVAQFCIDNGFLKNMMDSHLRKLFLKKRKMRRSEISRKRQELAEKTEPKESGKHDICKKPDGPSPSSCSAEGRGGRNYRSSEADVSGKHNRNSEDSGVGSYKSKTTGMPTTPSEADNFYKPDFESTDDEDDTQSWGGSTDDEDNIQSLGGSAATADDIQSLDGSALDPDNPDTLQDIGWSLGLDEKIECIDSLTKLSKEAMGEKEFDKAHNRFTRVLREQTAKSDSKQSTVQLAVESLDPPPNSFMLLLFVEQKIFFEIE